MATGPGTGNGSDVIQQLNGECGGRGAQGAVDRAIAACDGDMRVTVRALIVNCLECEVSELMKSVSHAYVGGRFHTYFG